MMQNNVLSNLQVYAYLLNAYILKHVKLDLI